MKNAYIVAVLATLAAVGQVRPAESKIMKTKTVGEVEVGFITRDKQSKQTGGFVIWIHNRGLEDAFFRFEPGRDTALQLKLTTPEGNEVPYAKLGVKRFAPAEPSGIGISAKSERMRALVCGNSHRESYRFQDLFDVSGGKFLLYVNVQIASGDKREIVAFDKISVEITSAE